MVRDIRIKEFRFTPQTFNTNGDDLTLYSDNPINGEILDVDWAFNRTGSIFLTISGTGEEFFRRNAPSGAGVQVGTPRKFNQITTGSTTIALGVELIPFIANDKIVLNVLNAASGAQTLDLNVRYR